MEVRHHVHHSARMAPGYRPADTGLASLSSKSAEPLPPRAQDGRGSASGVRVMQAVGQPPGEQGPAHQESSPLLDFDRWKPLFRRLHVWRPSPPRRWHQPARTSRNHPWRQREGARV